MQYPQYGSKELMNNWCNTDKYFASKKWEENRELKALRPTFKIFKRFRYVDWSPKIAEVGMGNGIHSKYLYDELKPSHLYLHDLNDPEREPAISLLKKDNVTFLKGDSLETIKQLPDDMDIIYLDGCHEFYHVLKEIVLAWPKLKVGGILGGHDYEHMGVMAAVQTLNINLWASTPKHFLHDMKIDYCSDDHPGYPHEYNEQHLPLEWSIIKYDSHPKELNLKLLRNG